MKTCTSCGNELPTSLDEYGDSQYPVCRSCWFDEPKLIPVVDPDIEIAATNAHINALKDDLDEIDSDFWLEMITEDEAASQRSLLHREINECRGHIAAMERLKENRAKAEREKYRAMFEKWAGEPCAASSVTDRT